MNYKELLLDELIATVENFADGLPFANAEQVFMLRYFIAHQEDPGIQEMIDAYFETFHEGEGDTNGEE